jgi:glycosyltransferase involved in cell wall biosynthesis
LRRERGAGRAVATHDDNHELIEAGMSAPPAEVVVDIAITAYGRADFVRDAVESVLAQTFDRWKLRICENGPGGGEIEAAVRPYLADERVSFRPSGRELPLAENWTRAIRMGSGRYVALLHDDDRWHRDFLQARFDVLEAHPECGFAFSGWALIDEQGTEKYRRAPLRFPEGVLGRPQLARELAKVNSIIGSTVLVRRSAYESVGFAFDGRWFYCDWEMWARLAARFPAYYLARYDIDFRRHDQANSFVTPEDPERLLATMDHIEQLFEEAVEGFELSRLERARARSFSLLLGANAVHQGSGWTNSVSLYLRALRLYPPTLLRYASLAMIAKSLLGRRGSRVVARALRVVRTR